MRWTFSSLKLLAFIFSCFFVFLRTERAPASACCGGGSGVPGVITGDERAVLNFELSSLRILTDVSQSRIWRDRTEVDATSSFRIQYAKIFSDRFQAGFSSSILRRDRSDFSSSGLGDTSLHLGYETLPDWNYSPWRLLCLSRWYPRSR